MTQFLPLHANLSLLQDMEYCGEHVSNLQVPCEETTPAHLNTALYFCKPIDWAMGKKTGHAAPMVKEDICSIAY